MNNDIVNSIKTNNDDNYNINNDNSNTNNVNNNDMKYDMN